jgi:quinol monooxygenase YgiN
MQFKVASYRVPNSVRHHFAAAVQTAIKATKSESGVLGYRGGFDLDDPEVFTVTGIYENEGVFEKHLKSEHMTAAVSKIKHLMKENGVKFMSAATFDCSEEGNSAEHHVSKLLA